ncbi:Hypp8375 [Branchiostoma lanceolatum]|uniref:Hypp8375 protein n=1 Tax=Branchiostoma lanceolatum TaxID=7740 RepID=A0A8J9Z7U3_BRALA|nr:Hypp8375 [Branchiostoma lanceolatum]
MPRNIPQNCEVHLKRFGSQTAVVVSLICIEEWDVTKEVVLTASHLENVWHQMECYLRKNVKPKNQDQLADAVTEFWTSQMTQEQRGRYIGHPPVVVTRQGYPSGY